jgi:hypothetical protein
MRYIWGIIFRTVGDFLAFLTFICIGLVAGSTIYTVIQKGPSFAFLLLLLIPLLAIIFYHSGKRRKLREINRIRDEWGREKLEKERTIEAIRALFDFSNSKEADNIYIDDCCCPAILSPLNVQRICHFLSQN